MRGARRSHTPKLDNRPAADLTPSWCWPSKGVRPTRCCSKDVTMWLLKRYGGASNTIFTDDEYWWIMKTTFSHRGDDHPESAVINRCFHELTSHLFFDFMMWWCVQLIRRPKHDHHFPRNERQSVGISGYPSSWRTNQDVECIHST